MNVDRIKLQEHCVEFALRLHPNKTIYKHSGMGSAYPNIAPTTEIIPPDLGLVLETANKIFSFIMESEKPAKRLALRRNKNVRARKIAKKK